MCGCVAGADAALSDAVFSRRLRLLAQGRCCCTVWTPTRWAPGTAGTADGQRLQHVADHRIIVWAAVSAARQGGRRGHGKRGYQRCAVDAAGHAAGLVLLVWALPRLIGHLGGRISVAWWIAVANPLMLTQLAGGPHNDILMVGLLAAATVLMLNAATVSRRY